MLPEPPAAAVTQTPPKAFVAADIVTVLRERGWLEAGREVETGSALKSWCTRAAELLGPHASDRAGLRDLLALIFNYDAFVSLQQTTNQDVLARSGARDVIRELANRILEGADVDSDRFKQIVEGIKRAVPYRSREIFHPIRLALTGRAGEGDLDRVILLLDEAAKLDFPVSVKGTRLRMLEFCAALD
jgi:nondiscriminating glutamyl-tRNA synthetase